MSIIMQEPAGHGVAAIDEGDSVALATNEEAGVAENGIEAGTGANPLHSPFGHCLWSSFPL